MVDERGSEVRHDHRPVRVEPSYARLAMRTLEILAPLSYPIAPRDGDCLKWAPQVTIALTEAGIEAETINVAGYLPGDVIAFIHVVTLIDGVLIVDYTARQFRTDFPERWVTPVDQYLLRLTSVMGLRRAAIWPEAKG